MRHNTAKRRRLPLFIRLILWLALLGAVGWTALVGHVCYLEYTLPEAREDTQAIIVLGAQVKADGTLSVQLTWRLDAAYAQYARRPQKIVVCGAQGKDEPEPEALSMRRYLISLGVPQEDILTDETSFNTRQNIRNAVALLPEGTTNVLIVTSDYHLPRAMALARDMGLDPSGVGSPIKLIWWPKNHYREGLAWVKYWLQSWGVMKV